MNKTPSLYQEKLKKISTTDADVTDDASSNRKYNFIRRRNLSTYHDRGNSQATEGSPQLKASKNSVADGSLLDADYIENLVTKVKELKSRMLYFERQCPPASNTHFDYRNQSIGDCDSTDFQNLQKNEKDVSDSSICRSKYTSNTRNYMDHQKSIYTTNEKKYSPLYSGNSCFQDSKNKSNKTNVSIVMSMHSSKKNVNTNKTGKPDPKQFQVAAEEFIQQAEDLKSKIGYILDCCGYNTPGSGFSVSSVTSASSKKCFSKRSRSRSSTRKTSSGNLNDDQLKIINTQYQEILKTLVSIDQTIKGFARAHLASKFGRKVDSNTSITSSKPSKKTKNKKHSEPKMKGSLGSHTSVIRIDSKAEMKLKEKGRKNKKEDKGCDRESCKVLQEQNNKGSSWSCFKVRSTSSDISRNKKSTAIKLDSKDKKKSSKSKRNDKLEPIVMVYEPIEPNSPASKNCRRCGKQPHPCKDLCSNRPSSESKKSEKHGFVVTYTPNINSESNTSLCASKKKSGKTPCCFGF